MNDSEFPETPNNSNQRFMDMEIFDNSSIAYTFQNEKYNVSGK